jgi:hypothetical protein
MTLVVTLTVRVDALDSFRLFEHQAARVMARHGGAIERSVVIPQGGGEEFFREVHIVSFPNAEAFAAYRADGTLAGIRHLRDESVVATEVLVGEDGPEYGTSPGSPEASHPLHYGS